ncbi:MAG TPA: insulinase family protein [Firmicutes bacterium]|nr:insulinase family protein [Bacillota bacterium]
MFSLSVVVKKKLHTIISFVLILLSITLSPISPAFGEDEESIFTPFTRVTLENGLTVIVKEKHFAPIVAVDIRVGVGSAYEPPELRGISHFVEHMFFKGTKRRQVGEIAREIEAVGGHLNAATSLDTTHYYVVAPSVYTDLVLDVTADAIQHSSFDPAEIDRERMVIIEEIKMYQDAPQTRLTEEIYMRLFAGTPYANNVIGTPETLGNIDREALVAYYKKHYVPNNIVMAVVGDVDTKQVLTSMERLFKDFERGEITPLPAFEVSQPKESARFEIEEDINQTHLFFGFPVPPLNFQDSAALEVLQAILDGGRSARLSKLYTEGLIINKSAGYTIYRELGLFGIFTTTQASALVEKRVQEILGEIIEEGVTEEEVAIAKAIIRTGYAMDGERAFSMACMMSRYEEMGSLEDRILYEQALAEVTKEDVRRVVEKYVNPQRATVFILKPKEAK